MAFFFASPTPTQNAASSSSASARPMSPQRLLVAPRPTGTPLPRAEPHRERHLPNLVDAGSGRVLTRDEVLEALGTLTSPGQGGIMMPSAPKRNKGKGSALPKPQSRSYSGGMVHAGLRFFSPGQITVVRSNRFVGYFTSTNGVVTQYASSFSLSTMPGYGDFTTAFDQYRIRRIEVWIHPRQNVANAASQVATSINACIDTDDDSLLTTFSAPLEYENSVEFNGLTGAYFNWVPEVSFAAYNAGATPSGMVQSPWLDCAVNDVKHFGIKAAVSAGPVTFQDTWDLCLRYHIDFKLLH